VADCYCADFHLDIGHFATWHFANGHLEFYIKTSCFEIIKFITEEYFTEHTNITTKLKLKLFTKLIKMPSEEAWVWIDTESN
jgi:hypothetical protein